jgi:outer membrane protein assembly factor BamD
MLGTGTPLMNDPLTTVATARPHRRVAAAAIRAAALVGALILAGCASNGQQDFTLEEARPAAEIFNDGLAYVQAGRYRDAIDTFQELDQYYPFSQDSRRGWVLMTFSAYQLQDYQTAIDTAERFMRAYPEAEDADYVLYLLGEAYLRTVPDITRDQEPARKAMDADQELLTRFPNSQYADAARLNIVAVRDQLAGQEMLVGRYYQERRQYAAAVNRFQTVVTDYQDTRHVEEALYRLTETYLAMGLVSEAQTAAAVLGANFPDSEWYQRAYDLLGAGGVEPSNGGGWLARAFGGGN